MHHRREVRYPGTSLCFTEDCPACGYVMAYPPVELPHRPPLCIWCADSERRPDCWRITADRWMLNRIYNADRYPVLPLVMQRTPAEGA